MENTSKNSHFVKLLEPFTSDFDNEECTIFLDQYNIKIVTYREGYLAYYGVKIGSGAYGLTKLSALLCFLQRFEINFQDIESLKASLALSFK